MRSSKKWMAILLSASMILGTAAPVWAGEFSDGVGSVAAAAFTDSDTEQPADDPPEPGEPSVTPEPGDPSVTPEPGDPSVTPEPGEPSVTPEPGEPSVTPEPTPVPVKPGWVKEDGNYYWRQEDGSYLTEKGIHTLGTKKYYLNSDGSRVMEAWKKDNNKYYYFQKNGSMYTKKGWFNNGGYRYYINADGSRRQGGFAVVDGKKFYLNTGTGHMLRNKTEYKIKGKYYDIDKNGVAVEISEVKMKAQKACRDFIKKKTKPGMSNAQKFRTCFNQLLWYMHYKPKGFNKKDFEGNDWPYKWALGVFTTNTGNCYGFACSVAMCAKELGYHPDIIITTGDHGFVMINGGYYDNMGGLFGASSHFAYRTYKRFRL